MIVQRQTTSEQYVCLSQGQAKRPAQLVAMQRKHMVKVNNKIATAKARAKRPAQLVAMQWKRRVKAKKKIDTAKARQNAPAELMALHNKDNEVQLHGGSVNYLPHFASEVSLL